MFQHGSTFNPLVLGVLLCFRNVGSAQSVHGPSLWPARRCELSTRVWEIRILASMASDVCWRRIYLHCTGAFSDVWARYALQIDAPIYLQTYNVSASTYSLAISHRCVLHLILRNRQRMLVTIDFTLKTTYIAHIYTYVAWQEHNSICR